MDQKRQVGLEAARRVEDGQVVGLGTGSTAHHFIKALGERIKDEELDILGIPTSYQSFFMAQECKIPVTTLDEHQVDLAVDGADEVDPQFNLIKGGGAAHTREKMVDYDALTFLVIVDESKIVDKLGKFPVPVEVLPTAYRVVKEKLLSLGGIPQLRMAHRKDGPVISDNNNFILDVQFTTIPDPVQLEMELNNIPGVLENGIFTGAVDEVLVGSSGEIKSLKNIKRS
ncbi:MAG TPA: ribose-5-phosphate isomerase RpiA [Methanobacteriaceae archaeon]|nr:ribose-5-phosphate isomerase RpiA [Methanobacteriaceae archaeon]